MYKIVPKSNQVILGTRERDKGYVQYSLILINFRSTSVVDRVDVLSGLRHLFVLFFQ